MLVILGFVGTIARGGGMGCAGAPARPCDRLAVTYRQMVQRYTGVAQCVGDPSCVLETMTRIVCGIVYAGGRPIARVDPNIKRGRKL